MRDIRHASDDSEKTIRNIPIHRRQRPSVSADHSELLPDGPARLPHRTKRNSRRFWLLALVVVGVCAVSGLLLSTVFSGATITVYPRTETVTVPASLSAQPNAPVGVLSYQTLTVTRSANLSVPAQGTQRVSRAASGLITISNTFSAAEQRLIANTRFESQDGKIYRIRDSVTVPGMAGEKAGTVTATIYADSPGPDYNKSAGATFTIPGFKGDPRYTKFTATSQGALSGGFIGDEPAVATADLAAAKTTLQQQLDKDVRAAAGSEIPEGFVAIPGTLEVAFGGLTQTPGEGKTASITQSATATGVIVRSGDLASAIARGAGIANYKGESVRFGEDTSMDVRLASSTKRADGTITLALAGQASLVWQFDQQGLLQAITGKGKGEFESIIKSFEPAITKADASIRPFWQGKFPDDPNKITVTISSK